LEKEQLRNGFFERLASPSSRERKKHVYSAPPAWPVDGPLHKLMRRLITQKNIQQLGFVQWEKVENIVSNAFEKGDESCFRLSWILAQWVVLGQKFGVQEAQPSV
jgi:asparagine synthase (glutamine-hydrolysing)